MVVQEVGGSLHLRFDFHPNILRDVKLIPGRRWNPSSKTWIVPKRHADKVHNLMKRHGFINDEPEEQIDYTITPLPDLNQSIPLKLDLYNYQRKGVAYALKKQRLIIGDQPGLGKTAQSIATIIGAKQFPCLVICPSSLKINWKREWEMWTNKKAIILKDSIKDTWPLYCENGFADVVITNYESLKKYFVKQINKKGKRLYLRDVVFKDNIKIFMSIIIDELHRCKDATTQQTKFVKGICIGKEWILGLKQLPDESVHCCVTSPPYWGLRDYGVDGQIGLEDTPEAFVEVMVQIFIEVKRVLRKDGTLWLNIGDTYAGSGFGYFNESNSYLQSTSRGTILEREKLREVKKNQKTKCNPKDLVGVPWMLAFALRESGWYLRQDIIWSKPNPMPESVKDRCTKSHEYIFLLSKSKKYFYDHESIKTPLKDQSIAALIRSIEKKPQGWANSNKYHDTDPRYPKRTPRPLDNRKGNQGTGGIPIGLNGSSFKNHKNYLKENGELLHSSKANKKSVWEVATQGFKQAHFATFPEKLIVDCIKAGTSEFGCCSNCKTPYKRVIDRKLVPTKKASYNSKVDDRDRAADKLDQGSNRSKDGHKPGWCYESKTTDWEANCNCNASVEKCIVLDPFMGAGTTALVARKLDRNYVGFELNPEYIEIANKRLKNELGIFI